jgi:uncharacterized membrane protein
MSRITQHFPQTQNTGRVPILTPSQRQPEPWQRGRLGDGRRPGGRPAEGLISRARQTEFPAPTVNVGDAERALSALGGSALAIYGLSRGTLGGLALAAIGGGFIYRGLSGHCPCYSSFGISTAEDRGSRTSVPAGSGVKVEKTITISKPVSEVYNFWRNLENLPRFMRHLESVKVEGNKSHWVAKAPLGMSVCWEAETITERPNELIGWRSVPGSMVDTAGSVHFKPTPDGRGTEVKVTLKYDPPAGKVGATLANWLGEAPEQQIEEDLETFKRLMETGQSPTTQGQPRGDEPFSRSV